MGIMGLSSGLQICSVMNEFITVRMKAGRKSEEVSE